MNIYQQIFEKLKQYSTIVIFGHTSPDGDCYGAQSGLRAFLKEVFPKKKVFMTGTGFKKAIPFMDEMDIVDDETIKKAIAVVVDVSDIERIEDKRVLECQEIVKFDHHLNSDLSTFQTLNASDTKASSTAQMIGQFILENGYSISKVVGERLFLGIVTDSGRFSYLSSARGMFTVLEEIMKAEIDFQKIFDFLYESDEITTRAKGYISYNFKTSKNGVAYIILNKDVLKELNIDYNYASSMVNCLSGMKEYPIWVSFCENEDGLTRVELRSKKYNVQQVAIKFNGGGHLQASGCRINDINDYHKVISVLDDILEENLCGKMN